MDARVAPQGVPRVAQDGRAALAERHLRADRLPGRELLRRAVGEEEAQQPRRSRSGDSRDLRQAGHPDRGAEAALERRRRCGVRLGVGRDDVPQQACRARHHLLLVLGSGEGSSRAGEAVRRFGRAAYRQLLRRAQLRGVQRRQLRLHPEGRALPDGAVDLLPHQRPEHRPVRADADHCGRGRDRQLPRRLHGAEARRKPAARRGRRADRAQGRDHQVLDRPELVPRRQERQGRHLQLRHQARHLQGRSLEDHLDAGRDRLRGDVEVSELHPAGQRFDRRVLFGRRHQQLPAGRHRHEDDPPRARTRAARSSRRASRPAAARTPIAARSRSARTPATRATTRSAIRC